MQFRPAAMPSANPDIMEVPEKDGNTGAKRFPIVDK
jgi:hypothetical protein